MVISTDTTGEVADEALKAVILFAMQHGNSSAKVKKITNVITKTLANGDQIVASIIKSAVSVTLIA